MGFDPISLGIGAVGQLGGAALGGKAQKNAAKLQMQSQDKALGFAREQEMRRRQDWQQAMAAMDARRNYLLQRYGVNLPSFPTQAPMGGAPMAPAQPMGVQAPGMNPALQAKLQGGGYLRGGTLRDILQG